MPPHTGMLTKIGDGRLPSCSQCQKYSLDCYRVPRKNPRRDTAVKPTTVSSADFIPSTNGASEEVGGNTITYAQRGRNPIAHAQDEPESSATNDQESALRHVALSEEPSYTNGHHDTFSFLELSAHSGGQNTSPSVVYSQEMSFPERSLDLQPSSTFTEAGSSGAVDGSFVKGATAGWEALPYSEDSAHNRQKAAGGHHAYLGIQYQNPWGLPRAR